MPRKATLLSENVCLNSSEALHPYWKIKALDKMFPYDLRNKTKLNKYR